MIDYTSLLPDEVLSLFFEAGMDLTRGSGPHFGELVSHVSGRWRSAALATPNLWTTVRYIQPYGMESTPLASDDLELQRFIAYLSRSRLAPVDIIVASYAELDFPSEIFQLLGYHVAHCRSLKIQLKGRRQILEYVSRQAMPILRSFSLSDFGEIIFSCPFLPSGAPVLKYLSLDDVDFETVQRFCLPAFQSVSHLTLETSIWDQDMERYLSLRGVLMALPSLSHLVLVSESMIADGPPIVLPTLQFLHVAFEVSAYVVGVCLKLIHAPTLHTVSIEGWALGLSGGPEGYDWSTWPQFPAIPSVKRLTFADRAAAPLVHLLAESLPNVEIITCRMYPGARADHVEGLLGCIIQPHSDETIPSHGTRWPRLQAIAISGPQNVSKFGRLSQVIRELQGPGRPIRKLLLTKECITQADARCASEDAADLASVKNFVEVECFVPDEWPKPQYFHDLRHVPDASIFYGPC